MSLSILSTQKKTHSFCAVVSPLDANSVEASPAKISKTQEMTLIFNQEGLNPFLPTLSESSVYYSK